MPHEQEICHRIVSLRRQVCPRTSYNTAGFGATNLMTYRNESNVSIDISLLHEMLLNSNEFESIKDYKDWEVMEQDAQGHVILLYGDIPNDSLQTHVANLIRANKTKLVFHITTQASLDGDNPIVMTNEISFAEENFSLNSMILKLRSFYTLSTRSKLTRSLPTIGFNGQPSVSTRNQFKTLWEGIGDDLEHARERVLQRIASKKNIDKTAWNQLISDAVKSGKDDWDIYSMIRKQVLGKTLEESLHLSHPSTDLKANQNNKDSVNNEEENEDGRSDHLVDMTFQCLPPNIQLSPELFVKNMLDYGCAEGAITATLGKKLKLSEQNIYGADVRAIPSAGFQFIQLPAEDNERSSSVGEILPQLSDNSISFINCAMVFHHVRHVETAVLELRRIISARGMVIIREHDCHSMGTAIFLDILHGLYSLAWKDPIEWPDFIEEYEAFYRNRQQWDNLMLSCGFLLPSNLPKQYRSAEISIVHKNSFGDYDRIKNITRAYYSLYLPNLKFQLYEHVKNKIQASASLDENISGKRVATSKIDHDNVAKKKKSVSFETKTWKETKSTSSIGKDDLVNIMFDIVESRSHPGKFYKFYKANGKAEWIYSF